MKYVDKNGQQKECFCPEGSAHSSIFQHDTSDLPSAADLDAVAAEESIKETTNVTEQPETPATPAPETPATPVLEAPATKKPINPAVAAMVDSLVGQLESAMDMVKAPAFVIEAAKGFIAALKKWAEEGE